MGEVGKVLKGRAGGPGCTDRMGRLRQLGEQRAGEVDDGEKEKRRVWSGWEEERKKKRGGCFKVSGTDYPWKAINLPQDLDDYRRANAHTHAHTHIQNTLREITPLNLVCLFFFNLSISFQPPPPSLCLNDCSVSKLKSQLQIIVLFLKVCV